MTGLKRRLSRLLGPDLIGFARSVVALYGLRLFAAGAAFLTQILLARWLGPAEFGVYVTAFALMTVGGFFSTLGMTAANLRFMPQLVAGGRIAEAKGLARFSGAMSAGAGLVAGVGGALAVWSLSPTPLPDDRLTLILGFLGIPLFGLLMAQSSTMQGLMRLWISFVPHLVIRPALLLILIVAVWLMAWPLTATTVTALLLVATLAALAAQRMWMTPEMLRRFSGVTPRYAPRTWTLAAAPTLFEMAYVGFFVEVNLLIAALVMSDKQLGIYAVGFRIANLIGLFLMAVGARFGPEAAMLWARQDKEALQRLIARATLLRFGFSGLAFAGVLAVGWPMLWLFGPDFTVGYPALVILALTQFVMGLSGPAAQMLSLAGHQNATALTAVTVMALNAVATLTMTPEFGTLGAAACVLITTTMWMLWLAYLVRRRLGLKASVFGVRAALAPRAETPKSVAAEPQTGD